MTRHWTGPAELAHLSARAVAAEFERRGLGKLSSQDHYARSRSSWAGGLINDIYPGGTGAGPYTENGTQYPGLMYSEINTPLNHRRKRDLRSRFALVPDIWPVFILTQAARTGNPARSALVLANAAVAVMWRVHNGE